MRTQKIYPTNIDGTMNNCRAPSMCTRQAFGYNGNTKIEYTIIGTDTGMSDESGEMLHKMFVLKTEQHYMTGCGYYNVVYQPIETRLTLYVNEAGDAFRTWKGRQKGRPVCNFNTGYVFHY